MTNVCAFNSIKTVHEEGQFIVGAHCNWSLVDGHVHSVSEDDTVVRRTLPTTHSRPLSISVVQMCPS